MAWSPNPFALAERLLDKPLSATDWSTSQAYLREAFNLDPVQVFDWVNDQQPLLEALQELSDSVNAPGMLDEVMQHPIVKRVQALCKLSDEALRRVLPYVVPLADVDFEPPGAGVPGDSHAHRTAGKYHPAGPIITDEVSYLDPKQGALADCYLVSSMISLAWAKQAAWTDRIRNAWHETPDRGLDFAFCKTPATSFPAVKVSAFLPDDAKGKPYTIGRDGDEAWPGMIEKAFVILQSTPQKEPTTADYQSIKNEMDPQVACAMLIASTKHSAGGPTTETPKRSAIVRERCNARGVTTVPTMAWTYPPKSKKTGDLDLAPHFNSTLMGLHRNHAYAVLGTLQGASSAGVPGTYIVLRNPWGTAPQPASFAVGTWRKNDNGREDVKLNSDGVFAVEQSVFDICCMTVGWVVPE
jgi:calpain family cysteine protease